MEEHKHIAEEEQRNIAETLQQPVVEETDRSDKGQKPIDGQPVSASNGDDKVDLVSSFRLLAAHKRSFLWATLVAIPLGVLIAFSIPKTYKSEVILAPEIASGLSLSGNLSDLASMVGVNLGKKTGADVDAIYPEIYPKVIYSTPFLTDLFDVVVSTKDNSIKNISLFTYLKDHQEHTWWDKGIGYISSKLEKEDSLDMGTTVTTVDNFRLTKIQNDIADDIKSSIKCNVDKKTSIITISVEAQDALICATVADTVQSRLQRYITEYRTKKSRNDLEYAEKLYENAEKQYVEARRKYAEFSDANEDLTLPSVITQRDELENNMQLYYNTYSQMAQQVQIARDKLRANTPAFTQIQPASVPVKKDAPKRMTIILGFMLLSYVITSFIILARGKA